jgi:hypothetical protein
VASLSSPPPPGPLLEMTAYVIPLGPLPCGGGVHISAGPLLPRRILFARTLDFRTFFELSVVTSVFGLFPAQHSRSILLPKRFIILLYCFAELNFYLSRALLPPSDIVARLCSCTYPPLPPSLRLPYDHVIVLSRSAYSRVSAYLFFA